MQKYVPSWHTHHVYISTQHNKFWFQACGIMTHPGNHVIASYSGSSPCQTGHGYKATMSYICVLPQLLMVTPIQLFVICFSHHQAIIIYDLVICFSQLRLHILLVNVSLHYKISISCASPITVHFLLRAYILYHGNFIYYTVGLAD